MFLLAHFAMNSSPEFVSNKVNKVSKILNQPCPISLIENRMLQEYPWGPTTHRDDMAVSINRRDNNP